MEHGGDILSYQKYYNGELIDFSSNINPLGIPKEMELAISQGIKALTSYPDIQYRGLKKSIAEYLNCPIDQVLVGNGAMEIIDLAIQSSNQVVSYYPGFLEYRKRSKIHNKPLLELPLEKDFNYRFTDISNYLVNNSLVILGNPNNPTGYCIEKEELLKLYHLICASDSYLLLDEAFYEFSPQKYNSIELFKKFDYRHIIIVRAATKFFSLPGIRLGYACLDREYAKIIASRQLPWSVNELASRAGEVINETRKFIKDSQVYIAREREFMLKAINKLSGVKAYPTEANYILLEFRDKTDEECLYSLLDKGYLIRTCGNYPGLNTHFIRIAIKKHEENQGLLIALEEFLKE